MKPSQLTYRLLATMLMLAAASNTAGAYPIEVPNWNFEVPRVSFPDGLLDGQSNYMIPSEQSWHQYNQYQNGGMNIFWNPGVGAEGEANSRWANVGFGGNAPEGDHVGLAVTRWNDDKYPDGTTVPTANINPATGEAYPETYVRDFEAICQVLENVPFDPNETYTLTVKVGHLPKGLVEGGSDTAPTTQGLPEWNGYLVQLLAGGEETTDNVGGLRDTVFASNGGTVIAEDDNTVAIAANTFETITVTYTPGDLTPEQAAALAGLPLQIRLGAYEDPLDHSTKSIAAFDEVLLDGPPPAPIATLTAPGQGQTDFTLEWNSYEGRAYNIYTSTDLTKWDPVVSGLTSSPPTNTYSLPPAGPNQFYRVEQVAAP